MMRTQKINRFFQAFLTLLAFLGVIAMILMNNQATMSEPFPLLFSGEYSRDGENWLPLTEQSNLSALDGDLFLRGSINEGCAGQTRFNFFVDHIGYRIIVNGAELDENPVMALGDQCLLLYPSACVREWTYMLGNTIQPEDEIRIELHNPHRFGNINAYRHFLSSLCLTPNFSDVLGNMLASHCRPFKAVGVIVLITALLLLGAAAASLALHVPMAEKVFQLGFLCACAGGFFLLDTPDRSILDNMLILNTYGRQICMMLFPLWLGFCLLNALSGKRKALAQGAMHLSALVDIALLLAVLCRKATIYGTGGVWALSQLLTIPVLAVCCVWELGQKHPGDTPVHSAHKKGKKHRSPSSVQSRERRGRQLDLLTGLVLYTAILLDFAGVGATFYSYGSCTKAVFLLAFLLYIWRMALRVVLNYQGALRMQAMQKELENSRISIMLSQIQPHFLYNALCVIQNLCHGKAPEAEEATREFSEYLRGNLDSLTADKPIRFEQELRHVHNYLSLEQKRFGQDLHVVYDIGPTLFRLPALSLQPMVENAVRYGVMQREEGGTVCIQTAETADAYLVIVQDDGVGFDPSAPKADGRTHIGIENVRKRLKQMCSGTLTIESTPGTGTKATLTLPKEETDENRRG